MSATPLIVVGGGEHARVVAEAVFSDLGTYDLLGFVDPGECEETVQRLGLRRLGSDELLATSTAHRILGVGAVGVTSVRQNVVARLARTGGQWARVIHSRAWLSPTAVIGEGTVVMAGAMIQSGAKVGAHCVINTGAVIEHDVEIGDFTQIGPAGAVGGGATVGAGSYVGLGARVRDHIRIGSGVLVGIGAVVIRDVPDKLVVMGVPAKAK